MIFEGILQSPYLLKRLFNLRNVVAFIVLTYYDSYIARLVQPVFPGLLSSNSFKKKKNPKHSHRSKPQQMLECFFSETFKFLHLAIFQIPYEVLKIFFYKFCFSEQNSRGHIWLGMAFFQKWLEISKTLIGIVECTQINKRPKPSNEVW